MQKHSVHACIQRCVVVKRSHLLVCNAKDTNALPAGAGGTFDSRRSVPARAGSAPAAAPPSATSGAPALGRPSCRRMRGAPGGRRRVAVRGSRPGRDNSAKQTGAVRAERGGWFQNIT